MTFHHIGYACKKIEPEMERLTALGYKQSSDFFVDANQGIRGVFLEEGGPRIELLENLENSNQLSSLLKAGIKMYHLGYVCDDIDAEIARLREQKAKIISPKTLSVYFKADISFLMLPNGFIVELIQNDNF